jgi:hypothetical protein
MIEDDGVSFTTYTNYPKLTTSSGVAGITVSGNVYTDEAKTIGIGVDKTVHLFVNGVDKSTCETNGDSYFSFSSISVAADDSVIVYLDGEPEDGSTVTLALDNTTAIANLHIITSHISLEHRSAGPIDNADLEDIDDADAENEDGITINGGAVFADGFELSIISGETYTPGGTVTCDDLEVEGTGEFNPAGNGVTVSGSWEISATGTFTSSGTVTFDAGSGTETIITGGVGASHDFQNLAKTNGGTLQLSTNAIEIDGTLTISASTVFDLNSQNFTLATLSNSGTLQLFGSETVSITTMDTDSGLVAYTGDGDASAETFTLKDFGATDYFNLKINDTHATKDTFQTNANLDVAGALNVTSGTLDISTNTNTLTTTGTLTVDGGILTATNGSIDANGAVVISSGTLTAPSGSFNAGGDWTCSGSAFTHNSGTVTFDAVDAGHTVNAGSSSFSNVIFSGVSGEWSPLTNTMTIIGDLTMTNGIFNTASGTANVTVNGDVKCGASCGTINLTSASTFKQSVGTSKSFGPQIDGDNDWTFYNLIFDSSAGTPTITFNGINTGTFTVSNDLTLTNTGTSLAVDNNTNNRILDVNNDVSIGAGVTFSAASSSAFNVGGNWTNSGAFTHGSGTVTFDAAADTKTLSGTLNGSSAFHNLTFGQTSGAATWNLSSALEVNNDLTIDFGTLGQGAHNINLDKNLAINANGNFTSGAGTFIFDGTTGPYTWTNAAAIDDLGAVEINGTTLVIHLGSSVKAASVNIYVSQTLSANGSNTLTLTGSGTPLTRGGTFTASTGTVEYTSGSGVTALASAAMTGSNAFNNLIINGTGTFTLGVDIESGNDLTVTSGTLTGTNNVTVKGNVTGAGTVTLTSGTFEQIVALDKTFGSSSGANNWTFNNLKFNNSDGAATRAITPNAGTGDIIISGTLTLGDSGTQTITFDNETSNDRVFDINGSILISSQGIFSASSTASFRVAANFTDNKTSGNGFTANSGTVTFDTTGTSILDGSNTTSIIFHNFTSTTADKTLNFTAGKTFRINGKFLIQGADSHQITINSTTASQWFINHQGTEDVTYAHISNSGCDGSSTNISLENTSTDNGNNSACWLFPSLSFTLDAASKSLDLNSVNTFTATATTTLTVSTSATFGYNLTAYETDNMRHTAYSSVTISDWAGTNAVPTVWTGTCIDNTQCGWGYNTGDADLTQFAANEYAGFVGSSQAPGDIVAKSTAPVTNDATTITYRTSVLATQSAGPYKTTIIYIVTPQF